MADYQERLDGRGAADQDEELQAAKQRAERAEAELARVQAQMGKAAGNSAASAEGNASGNKAENASAPSEAYALHDPNLHGIDALRQDPMMQHLLQSLDARTDIGHYGRLVFAMVARHFLSDEDVTAELTKDSDFSAEQAAALLRQVKQRDYNPPRRERILEWQAEQEFPIVPSPDDPDCGNVYRSLHFPEKTYKHIEEYQEERAASEA